MFPSMGTRGLFVYFMQGFSVCLCFLPSYWLDLSVCLAKSCVLSKGRAWRQMITHTHINAHTHIHWLVPEQPHRNQVIEQRLYPSIPDITERQKICMKEGLLTELPSFVCLCMCVFCSKTTPWFPEWEQAVVSLPLSPSLSHWSHLWSGSWLTARQPASMQMNLSPFTSIPSICLGMSLAWLCNEHEHSRVLF